MQTHGLRTLADNAAGQGGRLPGSEPIRRTSLHGVPASHLNMVENARRMLLRTIALLA